MFYSLFSCYPQVLSTMNKSNVEVVLTFQLVTSLFFCWCGCSERGWKSFKSFISSVIVVLRKQKWRKKKKKEKAQYKLPVIRFVSKCESVFLISQSEFSKIAMAVALKRKLCLYPRHHSSTDSESRYILMAFTKSLLGGFRWVGLVQLSLMKLSERVIVA